MRREMLVGQTESFSKTISEFDIYNFAGTIGDFNSAHIDEKKSKKSKFGGRIAHGMLVGSFISTVLGMKLPGPGTVYLEQTLKFLNPVYIGDTITAKVEVIEILNKIKGIYKMKTVVINQDETTVVDGYAIVKYKEQDGGSKDY